MPDWVGSIGGLMGTVGGYVVLIVALGGIVAYLRAARDKGTIITLEKNNEALSERVALLEASEQRLKAEALRIQVRHDAEMKALGVRLEALELRNTELESVRPSAEVLIDLTRASEALRVHLAQHDTDMKALLGEARHA